MRLAGKKIDIQQLIKPEYIGSMQGSSFKELKKAAEDNGMYAEPVANLTTMELRHLPYPIILHVKSEANSKDYDHFWLFLGTKNGQAQLFDPPEPVRLVPFRQLVPHWDGNGLIVSADPIDLGLIFAPARKRFIIYAMISIAIILIVRRGRHRWLSSLDTIAWHKLVGLSVAQNIGLAVAALLCGMVYHFTNDEGFLAHADATTSTQQAHLADFIPKVNKNKVKRLLNTDTVFIDARTAGDFKAGHIEGAINVPVNICDRGRRGALSTVPKDAQVVVYCQSAGCRFAQELAAKLLTDGFTNISIFKGGWNQWESETDD